MILTSGTTGTPKGAARKQPDSLEPAAALFSKIPLRAHETTMIAAPMFHSWGFAHFTLGVAARLDARAAPPLRPRGDAPRHRRAPRHRARGGAGDAAADPRARRPRRSPATTSAALRVIALSGSALPGELALRAMDTFGDVLYNLYGSTEVAWATIATPADLRAAPGTAGRPPLGTVVKLLDEQGAEVRPRRGRAHLRRQRDDLRGLHRRRRQGDRRRPDEHRRRRAPRRRADACSSKGATTK